MHDWFGLMLPIFSRQASYVGHCSTTLDTSDMTDEDKQLFGERCGARFSFLLRLSVEAAFIELLL